MASPGMPAFPDAAIEWLVDRPLASARLLVIGAASAPVIERLARTGASLVAVASSRAGLRVLTQRAPRALPVAARPERLPFVPCAFDAVFVHQSLHALPTEALPELSRVLKPGGRLAASWTIRDDSVPWVRRLAALMRDVDPSAMSGDYGTHAIDHVHDSQHFDDVERRNHRLWVPISRVDLLTMVADRFPTLDAARLTPLMAAVGALYEDAAKPPSPLLLPYAVTCWRASADHTEFTSQIRLPDDGLPISL